MISAEACAWSAASSSFEFWTLFCQTKAASRITTARQPKMNGPSQSGRCFGQPLVSLLADSKAGRSAVSPVITRQVTQRTVTDSYVELTPLTQLQTSSRLRNTCQQEAEALSKAENEEDIDTVHGLVAINITPGPCDAGLGLDRSRRWAHRRDPKFCAWNSRPASVVGPTVRYEVVAQRAHPATPAQFVGADVAARGRRTDDVSGIDRDLRADERVGGIGSTHRCPPRRESGRQFVLRRSSSPAGLARCRSGGRSRRCRRCQL
jgi:hypothetical protein